MCQYQGSVTQKNQSEVGGERIRELSEINAHISEAKNREEYLQVINNYLRKINSEENWNNLSLCLRRYIYESFTGKNPKENPSAYSVHLGKKSYRFGPVLDSQMPNDTEIEDYADLLYRLTLENECYAISRENKKEFNTGYSIVNSLIDCGVPNLKKGAISKKTYINYLHNHGITRKGLFTLSMALKFKAATMETFAKALGESPVYNFRNADECIFYFCHEMDAFRSMKFARIFKEMYEESITEEVAAVTGESGETRIIHKGLDEIIQEKYQDENAAKMAFLRYLLDNHNRFIGYSKTAQELLLQELQSADVIAFNYEIIPNIAKTGIPPMRYALEEDALNRVVQRYSYSAAGDEIYSILIDGIDLDDPDIDNEINEPSDVTKCELDLQNRKPQISNLHIDDRIKSNLLSGERLSDLLSSGTHISISKKDFLLLRFYKMAYSIDFTAINESTHLNVLKEFQSSTNAILDCAGLPSIYVGNPFDHLILTALCDKDPLQFLPQVFVLARKIGN